MSLLKLFYSIMKKKAIHLVITEFSITNTHCWVIKKNNEKAT